MTIFSFDFSRKFSISKEKIRTADINPILHKMAHFDRVNRKNKKRINLKNKICPVVYTRQNLNQQLGSSKIYRF